MHGSSRRHGSKGAVVADPTRDMYRVLSSRGVLVINEYSEEPPSKRLQSSLRTVRLLRRFFPSVHQIRTTTDHNTMYLACVDGDGGACTDGESAAGLFRRAARVSQALGLGGVDLAALLQCLPPNRHQVFS